MNRRIKDLKKLRIRKNFKKVSPCPRFLSAQGLPRAGWAPRTRPHLPLGLLLGPRGAQGPKDMACAIFFWVKLP